MTPLILAVCLTAQYPTPQYAAPQPMQQPVYAVPMPAYQTQVVALGAGAVIPPGHFGRMLGALGQKLEALRLAARAADRGDARRGARDADGLRAGPATDGAAGRVRRARVRAARGRAPAARQGPAGSCLRHAATAAAIRHAATTRTQHSALSTQHSQALGERSSGAESVI